MSDISTDEIPETPASPQRIYVSRDGKRFFLIPDDTTLPGGDLEIRSMGRPWAHVDGDAAEAYVVTRERAGMFAGDSLETGWQAIRRMAAQLSGQDESSLPEHLSDLLGEEPGRLLSDPEVARARAKDVLHRASTLLDEEVTVMKELGNRIKSELESTDVNETLEEVGQSLRSLGDELRGLFGPRITRPPKDSDDETP
jgi:hypothetical protein